MNGFCEIMAFESKILHLYQLANEINLIDDFCYISLCKSPWLAAKWNVKISFSVEADHPIETGSVQE